MLYVCWTGPWGTHGLLSVTPETAARANQTITGLLGFMRIHSSLGASFSLHSFSLIHKCQFNPNWNFQAAMNWGSSSSLSGVSHVKAHVFPPTLPRPAVAVLPFNLPYARPLQRKAKWRYEIKSWSPYSCLEIPFKYSILSEMCTVVNHVYLSTSIWYTLSTSSTEILPIWEFHQTFLYLFIYYYYYFCYWFTSTWSEWCTFLLSLVKTFSLFPCAIILF